MDLQVEDYSERLKEALVRTPYSGLNSAAMKMIETEGNPAWCDDVYRLWRSVQPSGEMPQPYLWINSVSFLLRHGYHAEEMLAALKLAGSADRGEAALLALEFARTWSYLGDCFSTHS